MQFGFIIKVHLLIDDGQVFSFAIMYNIDPYATYHYVLIEYENILVQLCETYLDQY